MMTVADYRMQLERRLAEGLAFGEAEDWIDDLPVSAEVKAALWLVAWAEEERGTQRRVAYEALAYAGAAKG